MHESKPPDSSGPSRRQGPHGKSSALGRTSTTACTRCRQKKKRCDQKLPNCRLCEQAGVTCYGYDSVSKRQVPRGYVHNLEERVAYLELKLQQYGASTEDDGWSPRPSTGTENVRNLPRLAASHTREDSTTQDVEMDTTSIVSDGSSSIQTAAVAEAERIFGMSQPKPRVDCLFASILLKQLVKLDMSPRNPSYRANSHTGELGSRPSSEVVVNLDTGLTSLPKEDAARGLVNAYFSFANLCMPLLHETTFEGYLALLYSMPSPVDLVKTHTSRECKIATFFVLEVFAVGLLLMQKQDPVNIPTWLADRYHRTAIRALNDVGLPDDLVGVQALALVAQYTYHHPEAWGVWKTVSACLRFAVELGLHRDPSDGGLDCLEVDTMRRTFWVVYGMERNVSRCYRLPCYLSDGEISTRFPSDIPDKYILPDGVAMADAPRFGPKGVSIHLFCYRLIQSEIQKVLYEKPAAPHGDLDIGQWQPQMRRRIDQWKESVPLSQNPKTSETVVVETFELTYQTALFYLYHPAPNHMSPLGPQLVSMTDAATRMIYLYRRFFREHKLTIYWQAVENLSSCGIAILHGYVQAPEVRETLTMQALQSLVNVCSSVLWAMVEHFPDFQGKRDAFDAAATRVLEELNAGTSTEMEDGLDSRQRRTPGPGRSHQISHERQHTTDNTSSLVSARGEISEELGGTSALLSGDGNSLGFNALPAFPDDFGDMSGIWQATADLSGTFYPTWI